MENNATTVLLSTTYFGPVQWYQKLCRYDRALIERHDTYRKQTYRNRCVIATAAGTQTLTVPVERGGGAERLLTKDVRISDHGNWRRLHWHALESAYSESPFFDYYADDLRPFFERRWEFLYDFNAETCATVCALLDIRPDIRGTEEYVKAPLLSPPRGEEAMRHETPAHSCANRIAGHEGGASSSPHGGNKRGPSDFRDAIDPKHPAPDPEFVPRPYYQVFGRRHGFQPNLSILDLLFNMGPEGIFWLL